MNYGFITGLPRSGSAWLANYLSYNNHCFLHDAWKKYHPAQLKDFFNTEGFFAGGTSDPANLMFIDEIDKHFPEAKWIFITRPAKDIKESCKALDFPLADVSKQIKKLQNREMLKVPFSEIFDRADEIGGYISKKFHSPIWRRNMLKDINVQLHWGRVSEQFKVPEVIDKIEALTPDKIAYYDLVKEITNGDPLAIRFLSQARDASNLYLQLNEGKPIDIEKAKDTLEAMATEWVVSPFLRNFGGSIVPSIVSALEKYRNEKSLAHCPIDTELLTAVTYIFRGNDGVKEYMPKVRELSDKILKDKA